MSFNGQKMNFRGGFTLMELLVVIAIIALLVSILMPSLQAAKTLARTAVCQSTMHNLALGNGMYMGDNDGFSIHGIEAWDWWDLNKIPGSNASRCDTGYGLPLFPIEVFDDDLANSKRGINPIAPGSKLDRNQMNNGGQNICSVGQLMFDKYIEESAAAIGCPQADFVEASPFSVGSSWGATAKQNYQFVIKLMDIPRMDPNKTYSGTDPNRTDPNAYWRNDYYSTSDGYNTNGNSWRGKRYISNYIVRGPMFRTGDILNQSSQSVITYYVLDFPSNAKPKADSQVAILADHEWADYILTCLDPAGLPLMGYDKPAYRYFPRRHTGGPIVAYTDGHAAMFPDESRQKTWNHDTGKFQGNQTHNYGNGWALIDHVYDGE